jgi:hypothetical protein
LGDEAKRSINTCPFFESFIKLRMQQAKANKPPQKTTEKLRGKEAFMMIILSLRRAYWARLKINLINGYNPF